MRTNIDIDDKLMQEALRATGAKTKREAVELGLRTLLQLRAQEKARDLKGKITWEGHLNAMRTKASSLSTPVSGSTISGQPTRRRLPCWIPASETSFWRSET